MYQHEIVWTKREDRIVERDYNTISHKLLAQRLKRTVKAIRVRAQRLGVAPTDTRREWSADDIATLYLPISHRQAADRLNRTKSAVSIKRFKLGLTGHHRPGTRYQKSHRRSVNNDFDRSLRVDQALIDSDFDLPT